MANCRSCGAEIVWTKTEAGRPMPVDAERAEGGTIILEHHAVGEPPIARVLTAEDLEVHRRQHEQNLARGLDDGSGELFVSHFATCPQAGEWRK